MGGAGAGMGSSGENISQVIAHGCLACSVRGRDPNNFLCPSTTAPPLPLRRGGSLSGK